MYVFYIHNICDFITLPVTSHKQEEWVETAKGIDNEVNSEKNKENVRALLSLIIDYKY